MHTAPNDSTDKKQVNIALNSLSGGGGGIFLQSSKVVIDCRPHGPQFPASENRKRTEKD